MLISLTHSSFKGIYLNLKKTAFYFFLLIAYNGYSQASINYSTVQGLPSNEVYDIHQDAEGFLWFATDNGVVRYDGLQFKIFHAKDGLSDPVVYIEKISTGTDIQIKLNIFGEELKDPKVNLFIFRITQELVVNSLKHANAKNITIHLSTFSDLMNILYEDDGSGFLNEEIIRVMDFTILNQEYNH